MSKSKWFDLAFAACLAVALFFVTLKDKLSGKTLDGKSFHWKKSK